MTEWEEPAYDTLPKLLRARAGRFGDRKVAMRVKDRGLWRRYTWKDYYEKTRDLCLGMIGLGFRRGDKVCIIGENKPEWFWAELAAQAAGGVAVGVFTDCIPREIKYFAEHSDSTFVFAHDQEQVDKILEIKQELPRLQKIIYWESKGLWSYGDPDLLPIQKVMEEGGRLRQQRPELFDELIDQGSPEDIGVICYTSGTTGLPKGAMLSQRWLVEGTRAWSRIDGWENREYEYLSFIPPAWVTEQGLGIAGLLVAGVCVNFPEEPETVQENIREVGPHILFYGARLWENVNRAVQARMIDSTALRQWIYKWFLAGGLKVAERQEKKYSPPLGWRIFRWLAHQAVFRALRDRLGLSRTEVVYSAGGAISPEIIRFFLAMGVEIKLFYGSTEMGVVSVPQRGDSPRGIGKACRLGRGEDLRGGGDPGQEPIHVFRLL